MAIPHPLPPLPGDYDHATFDHLRRRLFALSTDPTLGVLDLIRLARICMQVIEFVKDPNKLGPPMGNGIRPETLAKVQAALRLC